MFSILRHFKLINIVGFSASSMQFEWYSLSASLRKGSRSSIQILSFYSRFTLSISRYSIHREKIYPRAILNSWIAQLSWMIAPVAQRGLTHVNPCQLSVKHVPGAGQTPTQMESGGPSVKQVPQAWTLRALSPASPESREPWAPRAPETWAHPV